MEEDSQSADVKESNSFAESDKNGGMSSKSSPLPVEMRPLSSRSESVTISDDGEDDDSNQLKKAVSEPMPMLRLNTSLASDPALQPEARVISSRAEAVDNYENNSDADDVHMEEYPISIKLLSEEDDDSPPEKIRRRDDHPASVGKTSPRIPQLNSVISDMSRHPAFICVPCGIKYSSKSTLEAHQTFYCTHK